MTAGGILLLGMAVFLLGAGLFATITKWVFGGAAR